MAGGKEYRRRALKTGGPRENRQVDGLRITDEATLDVVSVRARGNRQHTRFSRGADTAVVAAVGLIRCGRGLRPGQRSAAPSAVAWAAWSISDADGVPDPAADVRLLQTLADRNRFVPVVACIGLAQRWTAEKNNQNPRKTTKPEKTNPNHNGQRKTKSQHH